MAEAGDIQTSNEIYLISSAADQCNAKIRNGLLDVKILIALDRGLEQWKPLPKAEFPVQTSTIVAQLFPSLRMEAPRLPNPQYSLERFLAEVISPQPGITIVPVSKVRRRFTWGMCQTEFSSVTIGGIALETVAVESPDPDGALMLIHELKIDTVANISYVRQIKSLLDK